MSPICEVVILTVLSVNIHINRVGPRRRLTSVGSGHNAFCVTCHITTTTARYGILMALLGDARLRWSCCDIFCQTKFWDSFINYTTCPPPTHKCLWQVCSSRSWDSDTLVNEPRRAFTEVIPHMKLKYLFITFPILGQNSSLFPNFHQVFAPTVFLLMFPHHHPTWKILDHFQMKLPNINCRYLGIKLLLFATLLSFCEPPLKFVYICES